jgi:hypothetical protein
MAFQVRIDERPTYLHVTVTGDNSLDSVAGYMEAVLRECTARQCFRVLVEERLEGPRLGTMQVFGLVSKGSERFRGVLQAMAYVDVNATGDLMGFAENVAVNRAVPVRVFASVAAAEEWLREAQPRSATAAVERADKPRR